MDNYIDSLMISEQIDCYGIIPFSECKIINRPLLERTLGCATPKSVIMLLIPYYNGEYEQRNVSLYAVPRDYHAYFKGLYSRLIPNLTEHFSGASFFGFSDHSPIGEVEAAARAGLGVIGDKFQLINEKYGSYTFIGEIITDLEFDHYTTSEIGLCNHCGSCSRACPADDECLSDLTQRKGDLSTKTKQLIKKTGIAWGCDICRTSCPMNRKIAKTPIDFFKKDLTPRVLSNEIMNMTKNEFLLRAYSWRGRKTILRNLSVLEEKNDF